MVSSLFKFRRQQFSSRWVRISNGCQIHNFEARDLPFCMVSPNNTEAMEVAVVLTEVAVAVVAVAVVVVVEKMAAVMVVAAKAA